jgi:two-component system chemotaxis response regulator CheY
MAVDKNMPILIVDDYATMLKIVRNLLNQLGFTNIDQATDGTSAIQKLKEKPFSLIISDWNMEPMSGLDLLKVVRANDNTRHIPFIMVTAESKTENVIIAKQAGVSNYIVKPFNVNTLQQKLTAVIGQF